MCEPRRVSPENGSSQGAQGFNRPEGDGVSREKEGEWEAHPAWWVARGAYQEDGPVT